METKQKEKLIKGILKDLVEPKIEVDAVKLQREFKIGYTRLMQLLTRLHKQEVISLKQNGCFVILDKSKFMEESVKFLCNYAPEDFIFRWYKKIDAGEGMIYGKLDHKLLDFHCINNLICNHFIYDEEFTRKVDEITGSKITEKTRVDEKKEEMYYLIHNNARNLVFVSLTIEYLAYRVKNNAMEILDEYWSGKLSEFTGF